MSQYMIQILIKSEEEARVVRDALTAYANQDISEHHRDIIWIYLADLTMKMRQKV